MGKSHLVRVVEPGIGEYSDGRWRYLEDNPQGKHKGSVARIPDDDPLREHQLDSERGKELVQMREQYRLEAMEKVPPRRLAEIADRLASKAIESDSIRDIAIASQELRQFFGINSRDGVGEMPDGVGARLELSPEVAADIVAAMQGNAT